MNTPEGSVAILPQRTNNILERFFRLIKRLGRKKSGTASLNRMLKAVLADTPLIRNLENAEYIDIILNDCETLAKRFSQIDANLVREQLKKDQNNQEKIPGEVKKLISQPDLPDKISILFKAAQQNLGQRLFAVTGLFTSFYISEWGRIRSTIFKRAIYRSSWNLCDVIRLSTVVTFFKIDRWNLLDCQSICQ